MCIRDSIESGLDISDGKKNLLLFAVTEMNNPKDIEQTLDLLRRIHD